MLDLKGMKSALEQLEQERKIPREKIIDAIEQALAAAYKKDYGKKGQIIRAKIDIESGEMEFQQIKIVVDETLVRMTKEDEDEPTVQASEVPLVGEEADKKEEKKELKLPKKEESDDF